MIELTVDGMTCGGCAAAVERAATPHARGKVEVDLAAKRVRLPDGADVAAASRAIEDAGFEVRPAA
jgi:copper chaperone